MNDVLTTEKFPVTMMLRVEDNRVVSLDIFGPPREGGATDRVAQWIAENTAKELEAAGITDEYPVNIWLAVEGAEFIPGQG